MADTEYLHVKNKSVRLVHLGGVMIPPGVVAAVVADKKGINKIDIESSEWLTETDEDCTDGYGPVVTEPVEAKPAAKAKKAAAEEPTTATGAGWNANAPKS